MTLTAPDLAHCWTLADAVHLIADLDDRDLYPLAARLIGTLDRTSHVRAVDLGGVHVHHGKPETRAPHLQPVAGSHLTLGDYWRDQFVKAIERGRLAQALVRAWIALDRVRHAPDNRPDDRDPDQSGDDRDVYILEEYRGYDPDTAAAAESVRGGYVSAKAIADLRWLNDCDRTTGHERMLKADALDVVLTRLRTEPDLTNEQLARETGKSTRTVQRYKDELRARGLLEASPPALKLAS